MPLSPDVPPFEPVTSAVQRWPLARAALDFLDEGITVFDADLRLVACNRRFLELLDLPAELGHCGTHFSEFIRFNALRGEYGSGDVEELVKTRCALARRFESHCMERTRPDGTILEIRGNPMGGEGFVTVYTDVTARRHADAALRESRDRLEERVEARTCELEGLNRRLRRETLAHKQTSEALRASEQWMRLIADAVPALIAYVDTGQRYRFANKRFEDWFGLPPDRIVGRPVAEILGEPLYAQRREHVMAALAGESVSHEYDLTDVHGNVLHVRSAYIPHRDAGGRVIGYFILAQDFTEHHQAQNALLQAQKMEALGQLTGGVAHDFNNLLTIIMGNLGLVSEGSEAPGEIQDAIRIALSAAERGAELTGRLLAFSRRQTLEPRVTELALLIDGVIALVRPTVDRSIDMSRTLDEEIWPALVDPYQLENALMNLVINARDAMPHGGRIVFHACNERRERDDSVLRSGEYVKLSVSDTGAGMPPEVVHRALEPFFTTKGNGVGSGLGLSMVYGFARQSGGHAEIRSHTAQGTTVTLYLPRGYGASAPATRATGCSAEWPSVAHQVAVVVEDDSEVRRYVGRLLEEFGYTVHYAENALAGRALLRDQRDVDLVVANRLMPDMGGIETVCRVRERPPAVKIICMCSNPEASSEEPDALGRHAVMLQKPFRKADLARAIRLCDRDAGVSI